MKIENISSCNSGCVMVKPFFSILLPTKNRSHLWPYALSSILSQSFKDFEVILVDNDDGVDSALSFCNISFLLDQRFRYFRTGNLNMSENWEYARKLSTGQFVLVCEDKGIFFPWTLEILYKTIQETKAHCIVFTQSSHQIPEVVDFKITPHIPTINFGSQPEPVTYKQYPTTEVISNFLHVGWSAIHDFGPRGINSVCSREVISKITENAGGFFHTVCPDATSDLLVLDYLDEIYFIGLPLVSFYMTMESSGGWKARSSMINAYATLFTWGSKGIEHMGNMPFPFLPLLHNYIFADYLKVRLYSTHNLKNTKLDSDVYFDKIFSDIEEMQRFGNDMTNVLNNYNKVRKSFKQSML